MRYRGNRAAGMAMGIAAVYVVTLGLRLTLADDRGVGVREKVSPVVVTDAAGAGVAFYAQSRALLVGVGGYTGGWPKLPGVAGEIREIASALEAHGFKATVVIDPDAAGLEKAFKDFIMQYGYDENTRLLFYFSGHGWSRKGGEHGYLVPADAPDPRKDEKGFLRRALPMSQILSWCKEMEAMHALFLFDSCFSGTIFKTKALPETPPHITANMAKPVRQFITAGDEGETVPSKSVFAPVFIRGLSGEADLSKDGYVTGTELGMYLRDKVIYYNAGQTPQYGKIRDPALDAGDFVFVVKPPEARVVELQAALDAKAAELKKLRDQEAQKADAERLATIERKTAELQRLEAEIEERKKRIGDLNARQFPERTESQDPKTHFYTIVPGDTLARIAAKEQTTVGLIRKLNKMSGDRIRVGQRLMILPVKGRVSLEVHKSAFTLYLLYDGKLIRKFAVGIGQGNLTPEGAFTITTLLVDPPWYKEGEAQSIPAGDPENILGTRWLGFSEPAERYGIHGTMRPETIGQVAPNGCIRMKNEDVEDLFLYCQGGTPVVVLNERTERSDAATPSSIGKLEELRRLEAEIEESRKRLGGRTGDRYGSRSQGEQQSLTAKYGGDRTTQEAVRMALVWLSKHQSADGRWDVDGFDKSCTSGRCGGKGEACWDVGVTGLALEAFLGHGDTHKADGPYKETVEKAIRYLLSTQQAGGCFGEEKKAASQEPLMYNQCLATYALAEAFGMTKDPNLREPVERAVRYLLEAQNPGKGWRYANYRKNSMEEEYGYNDTSVTGWAVMALHAAEDAGIAVPKSAYDGANAWLDEVQQTKEFKVTYGYNAPGKWLPGDGRYVATAAGALIRQFTGVDRGVDGTIPVLLDRLPDHKKLNSYLWYYATLVTFQNGGEPWENWNAALKREVCTNLHKDDTDKCVWGSMDPDEIGWGGKAGGRIYSTACAALCMEVYYRYKLIR